MFRWIVLIGCLLGVTIGLIIGVMNPQSVDVVLPGLEFTLGLGGLLVLVFVLGVAFGLLLFLVLFQLPGRMRRRSKPVTASGAEMSGPDA